MKNQLSDQFLHPIKKQTVGSVPRIQFHILISTWKLSIRMVKSKDLIGLPSSSFDGIC
jgi:hypothetical protein